MMKVYAQSLASNKGYKVGGKTKKYESTSIQGKYYEKTGTSGLGATSKTRGRQAPIRRVR